WVVYDMLYQKSLREQIIGQNQSFNRLMAVRSLEISHEGEESFKPWAGMVRPMFSLPVDQWLSLQLDMPIAEKGRLLRSVLFKHVGLEEEVSQPGAPDAPAYQYRLTFMPETAPINTSVLDLRTGILRAECWIGEYRGSPKASIFRFFHFLDGDKSISSG